ncbi:short-chain fatty acyl-CoA regulator family protein [Litorimonas sp. WD9-15]|uniref:helix-turn-helix domain-containing protein n=1 Tax=Litorimonas sp. WD9-15 TaxID=3418716 RepID=UPI003CFCB0EF
MSDKLLIGPKLRRFRNSLGLTQARMAEDLGISASYLNLIERNQRAMSAKVLLKMAGVYDFDISAFSDAGDAQLVASTYEALRAPRFRDMPVSKNEVEDVVGISPNIARAFQSVLKTQGTMTTPTDDSSPRAVDIVRDFIQSNSNYFPEIDETAEALCEELGLRRSEPRTALTERLKSRHDTAVQIVPTNVMPDMLRWFDRHNQRIHLSELMSQSSRRFQLAVQIGLLEQREMFDAHLDRAKITGREARGLARTSLANYFAAALLMPYAKFLREAEATRYDVELLSHRFGTSFEQAAHRLTTLNKPDARGIPFFFLRIDIAGNVSKRFSAGKFAFASQGGACPIWNIHESFTDPGRLHTQMVQLPDGATYFSIAKAVKRAGEMHGAPAQRLAIALGCDVSYAPRLCYSKDFNLDEPTPAPIGINCYLCERQHCRQRAHPPLAKSLMFDERARGMSLYRWVPD